MTIQASAENYLEAILVLQKKNGKVKSIDIANHLNFSKPTISITMKKFRDNGYITIDDKKNIHLTEKGEEIAVRMQERHLLLSKVLILIGVEETQAFEDACKMEHAISDMTFERIREFYDRIMKSVFQPDLR